MIFCDAPLYCHLYLLLMLMLLVTLFTTQVDDTEEFCHHNNYDWVDWSLGWLCE